MITIIAALDKNNVIGKGNALPWHLPADLAHFKKETNGYPIIMGKNTFLSIGKPLPGRKNIVLSTMEEALQGCTIAHSFPEALEYAGRENSDVFVIGGAFVFEQALPYADRLMLTYIDTEVREGDVFFPKFSLDKWKEVRRIAYPADDANAYAMEFVVYEAKRP